MKKALCFLLIVCSVFLLTACSRNNKDIAVYEQRAAEDRIMPTRDELGDYVSLHSLCHYESELFFSWEGWNLIVEYTAENYASQKTQVEGKYTFKDHPYNPYKYHLSENDSPYETTVGAFFFRGLDDLAYFGDSKSENFPKLVYMIGFNDKEHKIAYVRFYDSDLDTADSLEELLRYAGWYQLDDE